MKYKKWIPYVGDFETTVYEGQDHTEVWASALVPLYSDNVIIFHSIKETFDYLKSLNGNILVYYHNLKFDGSFWLDYLLVQLGMEQAFQCDKDETGKPLRDSAGRIVNCYSLDDDDMPNNSFKYSISDMGQWYSFTIKIGGKFIQLRDSLKLLPFSVKKIGKSFATKHKKLDMEYTGFRYAGCEITPDEKQYIANDVLVVKEAMEIMYNEGHNKMTIGSCCLSEYKKIIGNELWDIYFPDMYAGFETEKDALAFQKYHGYSTYGDWIRKAYRGGWCYLVKGKENRMFYNGTTADVNSLYPSMMSSESGNRYPIGKPTFWSGDTIPYEARQPWNYYFVRVKTRFYLKAGYLPFIQIKGSPHYVGTECLERSDFRNYKTGEYCRYIKGSNGEMIDSIVTMTLTMTDFELIKEHYHLVDFEVIDGCYFRSEIGIFDEYIEKYKMLKMTSTGAKRELAKLFLNNLYGKMAASKDSSFKFAIVKDDGNIGFEYVEENEKTPGYIPVGAAITSYARNFTIRAAQKNYHGVDNPGFIYADTDSIHCDLPPEKIAGIAVDDKLFCHWKLESCWDFAWFARQKTYIEHITGENLKPVEPYYNVKCAGMPERCKQLFIAGLDSKDVEAGNDYTESEADFINQHNGIDKFTIGLCVPGKLLPKRIPGGILLCETNYEMR